VALREKAARQRDGRGKDDGQDARVEKATEAAEDRLEDAGERGDDAKSTAESAVSAAVDAVKDGAKGSSKGLLKVVATAARDAAAEVLEREARAGAKQAAEYLSQKAPELARQRLEEQGGGGPAAKAAMAFGKAKLEGAGGPKALLEGAGGAVKGVVDKVTPGGGGDGGKEKSLGQTRRLPVECSIDIGAARETVYNQWTQFEDAPRYMHRITSVEQVDDKKLKVQGKIWGFKREWTVEIEEQVPNERIQWKVVGGTRHTGVVTFHELEEDLTRVLVILDFPPQGLTEKMASGLRLVKRATTADLKRFRAFIMMHNEETGAWRGKIEDGEVISPEELEEQQADDDAEADEDYEDDREQEPEAESDEDYEDEGPADDDDYEEEAEQEPEEEQEPEAEEEEPAPAARRPQPKRQRSRSASSSSSGSTRRKSRAS
jgi:uncharacterized membrane protein